VRLVPALTAAALTLGLVAAGAPAAQANDIDYRTCQFSEGELYGDDPGNSLVVGTTHERSVYVSLTASGCPDFGSVEEGTNYENPSLHFGDVVSGDLYSWPSMPEYINGSVSTSPELVTNSMAGKSMKGVIWMPDGTTRPFPGQGLILKRKVMADATKASSTTVKKGKKVTVSSKFVRADWDKDKYTPSGMKVSVEFRDINADMGNPDDPDAAFHKVGWATTDKKGKVSASVKVPYNGCFKFIYLGSSTTGAEKSDEVCVKTKK
jgi:hypothetical protein